MLRLNTVLAGLSHDSVKSDFLTGEHGAAVSDTLTLMICNRLVLLTVNFDS